MTSVPQLPMEATSAKTAQAGDAERGRAQKAKEVGGEVGFAAALAQASPVPPPATNSSKKDRAIETKGAGGQEEGDSPPDGKAVATQHQPPDKARLPTLPAAARMAETFIPEVAAGEVKLPRNTQVAEVEAPVAAAAVAGSTDETLHEIGDEAVEGSETTEKRPAASHLAEAAAARTAEQSATESAYAADVVEVEETRRREPARALEPSSEAPEEETAEAKLEWKATEPRRSTESAQPERVQARADAVIPATNAAATAPQRQETREVPRSRGFAEPRRAMETPADAKTPQLQADDEPVIEFQVRRERPAQDTHPRPEADSGLRALVSRSSDTHAKSWPQSEAVAVQPKVAVQQASVAAPVADAETAAKHAEKVVSVAEAPQRAVERVRVKDAKPAPLRVAEQVELPRPLTKSVAAGTRGDEQQGGDAAYVGEEPLERKARPVPALVGVNVIAAKPVGDAPADTEPAKQEAVKPMAVSTPTVQPANGPQAAPVSAAPLTALNERPLQETGPIVSTKSPNEPKIAAQLQQEGGRTTLNVVLQDERLGRVALQLVERGGWIETAIRASDPRTAQTLSSGAAGLFEALQQRGLTSSAGSGASAWDAQEGQRRDNPQREQEPQRRRFRLRRSGGEFEGAMARAEV